jgi:hypothetical protein
MKKTLLIASALFLFVFASNAQKAATSIYVEVGGPSLAAFNFDTRFGKTQGGIGGRIGFGGFSIDGEGAIFIPIGLNYLIGKDEKNWFELGAGVTPILGTGASDGNFSSTFGHILFGYRLQPKDGGFTFRAFVSPVFGEGFFVPYYGGVSFGYKF